MDRAHIRELERRAALFTPSTEREEALQSLHRGDSHVTMSAVVAIFHHFSRLFSWSFHGGVP